jgi:hypothetical protein
MKMMKPFPAVDESTGLRELLQQHPTAIRVLLDRDVPISCAGGTVRDAAQACGVAPATLLAEIVECAANSSSVVDTETGRPLSSQAATAGSESLTLTPRDLTGGPDVTTTDWHALPIESVLERLQTRSDVGLTSDEANHRLALHGPNMVHVAPAKRRKPWWRSIRWASPGWSGRRWTWY